MPRGKASDETLSSASMLDLTNANYYVAVGLPSDMFDQTRPDGREGLSRIVHLVPMYPGFVPMRFTMPVYGILWNIVVELCKDFYLGILKINLP